ncbi:MAG: site-2 protease family protein [Thermoleophilia bacterium]|nr:site-2 protease family protein [Thermoleophilia bacterium]MDH3724127.1 site-2 protease family protein [Thermoleophilia bacterium]
MSVDSILDIGLFVAILMFLVLVHELGHLVVAKWSGMKVERFSIFFGRPITSFQRGETEYGIGWLPLGGYVKITGMTRSEDVPPEDEARTYYNATTGRRIATILAGPAVNIVVAFIAFAAIAWIGTPNFSLANEVAAVTTSVDGEPTPAAQLGLEPGDRLISVNNVRAEPGIVEGIRYQIQENVGTTIEVVYERDGEQLTGAVAPVVINEELGRGQLGFTFAQIPEEGRTNLGPIDGLDFGWDRMVLLTEAYGDLFKRLIFEEEARQQVNSVVGAGAIFDVVADDGLITIIAFLGAISFALGVFNLLPILPLDGGHIVIALTERIMGKPLPGKVYERIALFGIILVVLAFLYILQNDIELIRGGNIAEELGR